MPPSNEDLSEIPTNVSESAVQRKLQHLSSSQNTSSSSGEARTLKRNTHVFAGPQVVRTPDERPYCIGCIPPCYPFGSARRGCCASYLETWKHGTRHARSTQKGAMLLEYHRTDRQDLYLGSSSAHAGVKHGSRRRLGRHRNLPATVWTPQRIPQCWNN